MTEMSLLCDLSLKFKLALYLIEQTQLNNYAPPVQLMTHKPSADSFKFQSNIVYFPL